MNTEFRILDIDGVRTAAEWARREGWNPGLEDATAFAAMDPEGFLGLYAGGDLAATISLVSYGAFGFLGFYICRPDLRGKGLGLALWNHAITHKACATIGLLPSRRGVSVPMIPIANRAKARSPAIGRNASAALTALSISVTPV